MVVLSTERRQGMITLNDIINVLSDNKLTYEEKSGWMHSNHITVQDLIDNQRKEGTMIATCIKADPLQWLEVGKDYECQERYNKVHIVGIGMVVSKEIFNEHFEIRKEQ